jgi:hypothetical protein
LSGAFSEYDFPRRELVDPTVVIRNRVVWDIVPDILLVRKPYPQNARKKFLHMLGTSTTPKKSLNIPKDLTL